MKGVTPMMQPPLLKTDEVYSKEERERMLVQMHATSSTFYAMAVQIRNHPFIEFAGLMNEYIKLCEQAHRKGIDFTQCNVHTGQPLPIEAFHVRYLDEKLGCIILRSGTRAA